MASVYDFEARRLNGAPEKLADFSGQVLLIVNVASNCGFTPQYRGLEDLYRVNKDQGFSVLGFPCNQFGAQEPGSAEEIAEFCSLGYDVSFPMFEKIEVNGPATHPLYSHLKAARPGIFGTRGVKWNFTKFLVDRAGKVVARFSPSVKPQAIEGAIKKLL